MRRIFVKICGLRHAEHIAAAVEAGADALGFVFARSPRQLRVEQAAPLLAGVPAGIERIAVCRQPGPELLAALAELPLDWLQADAGWQPPEDLRARFLPALRDGPELAARLRALAPRSERVLVDAAGGGGTGQPADWRRVAAAAAGLPIILAGGLHAENVATAIAVVRPWGVDVSSGVELRRGQKDAQKIHDFVRAARTAHRLLPESRP